MNTRMLGRVLFSAAIVGASLCAWPPDVRAQNPPWGVVAVRPAPVDFSYTVEQVYFKQPWSYKNMASKIEKAMVAIKVTIYGRGFKEQDTGPVVWWNRIRHQAIRVSPDGDIVEAYFFHPYKEFEQVGRDLRGWELIYAAHFPGAEVYRIGPRGRKSNEPKELAAPPPLRLLTEAEWQHAGELAKQFGVSMPPR